MPVRVLNSHTESIGVRASTSGVGRKQCFRVIAAATSSVSLGKGRNGIGEVYLNHLICVTLPGLSAPPATDIFDPTDRTVQWSDRRSV